MLSCWLTEEPLFQFTLAMLMLGGCVFFYADGSSPAPIVLGADEQPLPEPSDLAPKQGRSEKDRNDLSRTRFTSKKMGSSESSEAARSDAERDGIDKGDGVFEWNEDERYRKNRKDD